MSDGATAREQFVLRWQQPIYSYARRMVGDADAAADITQDTLLQGLRHLERIEQPGAWLYRVATNAAYRHLRAEKTRRAKEKEAALNELAADPAGAGEAAESQRLVEAELARLPVESRALLLLHYYNGLSQREMADVLNVPRTTIADRLRGALRELESCLRRGGHLALIPNLEGIMTATPELAVPPALHASLATLAAGGAVATGGGVIAWMTGGTIMTSKITTVVLALAAVACLAGFVRERAASHEARGQAEELATQLASAARERQAAVVESEKLAAQMRRVQEEQTQLARKLAEVERLATEREAALAGGAKTEPATSTDPAAPADGIDWQGLATVTRENRALFFHIADLMAGKGGANQIGPEHMAKRQLVLSELDKAAALARMHTPQPILDERYLPKIVEVYLGAILDLDEAAQKRFGGMSLELLEGIEVPEDGTPAEWLRARRTLLERLGERIDPELSPEQRDDWHRLAPLWKDVERGTVRTLSIGIDSPNARTQLLTEWRNQYRTADEQREPLERLVEDYLVAARALLERIGAGDPEGADEPTPATTAALDGEMHLLQVRMERNVLALLTEEQLAVLAAQTPLCIRFTPGIDMHVRSERAPGF